MSIWGIGILKGLAITLRNMFRGPITVEYPKQKIELPERARWAVQMKLDEEGNHKCTGCLACERACPDYIIKIDITTGEDRSKHIDAWNYEIGGCMMCGLCVEACPFDAIRMGHDYELARINPAELKTTLLEDVDVAKPKRKERPAGEARPAPAARDAVTPTAPAAESAPAAGAAPEPARDADDSEPEPAKEGSANE